MSRLILYAGRRFGRFAVLLFVAPVALIFYLWLTLLDTNPVWFFGTAIVMLPLTTLATAFLVATLAAGFRRRKIKGVDKAAAPGLWSAWESIAGPRRAAKTVIVIDDQCNAGVGRERVFGPVGSRIILTVGIPLLATADQKTIVAVLAHENAHVVNKDTNGSLNLAEFGKTFDFVYEYASPKRTISGRLLFAAMGWLAKSLEKEQARLSREAEIAADRHAAASGNAAETAQAFLLFAAAGAFVGEVDKALQLELLGAMSPPQPPLQRLLEAAQRLSDRTLLNAYARKALEQTADEVSSHPSWAQRLLALGFAEPPEIEPIATTALSTMLSENTATQIVHDFDRAWTRRVVNALQR